MSWQTNSTLITLRSAARKAGLTRLLGRILAPRTYEDAFDKVLFANLRDRDTVWDVGANVGYYTRRFAQAVGSSGKVVAFEPFPETAALLRANLGGVSNFELLNIALGAEVGVKKMMIGDDELGATNRIVEGGEGGAEVAVATGDGLLAEGRVPAPNVIKIDTEGHELDVLRGMPKLLVTRGLRAVFVEIHFGLLANRGMKNAPAEIQSILNSADFATKWVDSSHIVALRS